MANRIMIDMRVCWRRGDAYWRGDVGRFDGLARRNARRRAKSRPAGMSAFSGAGRIVLRHNISGGISKAKRVPAAVQASTSRALISRDDTRRPRIGISPLWGDAGSS